MTEKITRKVFLPDPRYVLDHVVENANEQLRDGTETPAMELPSLFERAKMLVNKVGMVYVRHIRRDK
jgi:hypothetical protein